MVALSAVSTVGRLRGHLKTLARIILPFYIQDALHIKDSLPAAADVTYRSNSNDPIAWSRSKIEHKAELSDRHSRFWWHTVGYTLAALFEAAEYRQEVQIQHLSFFLEQCAPHLGECYSQEENKYGSWKSFMTDNNCPVEISWDWGWNEQEPTVRYSLEPINRSAGTVQDPLNRDAASRMLSRLQEKYQLGDRRLFDHFSEGILDHGSNYQEVKKHNSEVFLAFDLDGPNVNVKAYFIASRKASLEKRSDFDIIFESIRKLPGYETDIEPAMCDLTGFMKVAERRKWPLEAEGLGIDCVEVAKARYKIYLRHRDWTFDSIENVVTLGGRLHSDDVASSLKELRELWSALLSNGLVKPDDCARINGHRTGGILYNFEIRPNRELAVPKVYLPVRHHVANDSQVLEATLAFLERKSRGGSAPSYSKHLVDTLAGLA